MVPPAGDPAPGRPRVPAGRLLWSLAEDTLVIADGGAVTVVAGPRRVEVAAPSPNVRDVLRRMSLGPVALENVPGLRSSFDSWTAGGDDCGPWHEVKETLDGLGPLVVLSLGCDGGDGLVLSVSGEAEPGAIVPVPDVDPASPTRLRATARLRGAARAVLLTDPGSPFTVVLHAESAVAVVRELGHRTRTAHDLVTAERELEFVVDVLAFLTGAGMLVGRSP